LGEVDRDSFPKGGVCGACWRQILAGKCEPRPGHIYIQRVAVGGSLSQGGARKNQRSSGERKNIRPHIARKVMTEGKASDCSILRDQRGKNK